MNALRIRMSSLWSAVLRSGRAGKSLRDFARAERGSAAMFFALSSPVWLGGLALGTEVGSWYYAQQRLQSAADIVASSLVGRAGTGASQEELEAFATHILVRDQFDFNTGSVTVSIASAGSPVFVDGNTVNVELTRSIPRYLSRIFQSDELIIRANATARVTMASQGCILSAKVQENVSLRIGGNIRVNGCELLSNGDYILVEPGSSVVTDCARSRSFIHLGGSLSVNCRDGQPEMAAGITLDPYADLEDLDLSLVTDCSTTGSVVIMSQSELDAQVVPIIVNGRRYVRMCAGRSLTISGAGSITLPGSTTFIFDGSNFDLQYTNLTGVNVSFYFLNGGRPVINAPAQRLTLTTDDPSGLLFRGARTNSISDENRFIVGSGSALQGAIYFPASAISFQAAGSLGGCPQIIGSRVTLRGTWQMNGPCSAPGIRPIVASRDVRLTQ